MTKTERRRNQYAGQCGVCHVDVAPGAGWLYSDTRSNRSRSRHRSSGNWIKVVRCDRCHNLGVSHRSQLPENAPPKPAKLGVDAIRGGRLVPTYEKIGNWMEDVVRLVLADGTSEVVACLTPIDMEVTGITRIREWAEVPRFGGRMLTFAAAKEVELISWFAAESLETQDTQRAGD